MSFTGDMFEIALPGVDGGHVVNVTVMFESGPCSRATIASFTGEYIIFTVYVSYDINCLQCLNELSLMWC